MRAGENSAGAGGPGQFLAGTWERYGVDSDRDGIKDRYNPADAIPSTANLLRQNGAPGEYRRAVFAYNHASWYVDEVLSRAAACGARRLARAEVVDGEADAEPAQTGEHRFGESARSGGARERTQSTSSSSSRKLRRPAHRGQCRHGRAGARVLPRARRVGAGHERRRRRDRERHPADRPVLSARAGDMAEVAAVAEESAASTEQVSTATQETSASTQQIAASAQELAATAEQLERLVALFRLEARRLTGRDGDERAGAGAARRGVRRAQSHRPPPGFGAAGLGLALGR